MNQMSRIPRHKQKPISIRSDAAAELLAQLTRDGRSQAEVIEDALKKEVAAKPRLSKAELRALIDDALRPVRGYSGPSRLEIEAEMYDENGLPR